MDTLVLLGAILVAAIGYHWAKRRPGSERPPLAQHPQPAATASPPAPTPPAAVSAADPPFPVPHQAPVVPATPAGPLLRDAVWAMIGGGGLLFFLARWIDRFLLPGEKLPTSLLSIMGGLFVLAGGTTSVRAALPRWLGRPLAQLATYLRISPAQVILLLLAPGFAVLARLAAGDGLLARQAVAAILSWLLAIAFVVAGSVARESRRSKAGDRWDWLLAGLLFAVALGLRAYQTARFPNTFSGDEGSAGLFAIELLTGKANNLLALGWFSFPALYFAVQSAAIAWLGATVEAVRLTSAVAGALTVVALYWLARLMFDRPTAILAAAYLAASHFHIHMSRIALNNIWDGLFATLAILALYHGWQSGRRSGFIACGLALGLGQYFYVSIRVLPILFLIWAAAAFWRQRALFRERLPGLIVASFIALVIFLPLGLYFVEHPDNFQAPLNRVTIFGEWMDNTRENTGQTATEIMVDQFSLAILGFTHEPLRLLYNPGSPLLLAGAAALFLLGLLVALLNFDLRYLLLILPLLATVASTAMSVGAPASQRYVMAMPIVALFVALPLGQAVAWLRQKSPRLRQTALAAAFLLMFLVAAIDVDYYFNRVYDNYILGDINTLAATQLGYYLRDKEPADQAVYFFGFPRMGYFSLSTVPFLAPEKRAQDVIEPLTGPPEMTLDGPTLFIFLPERLHEMEWVRQRYPDGVTHVFHAATGELLFVIYEV